MQRKKVKIPNINCGHCVNTIQSEIGELSGVVSVRADEQSKSADIAWNEPATWEQIKALLTELNYPPAE